MTKLCIVCGNLLSGRRTKTCSDKCYREYRKEYQREWNRKNSEKIKERKRQYRLNNLEKIKERDREYRQNNREKINEYHQNNQETILENQRKRYRRERGLPEDWDLSRESSIETIMRRWLQESEIEFVQQHTINLENSTWTHVDFFIPEANVCLYCDGDYWHSLPEVQERDIRINRALEGIGHSVVRMTETEILEENRPWWIGELIPAKW